jgi:hypothetical protein
MPDPDDDPWPHAPPFLEDPDTFGSAWWKRLKTSLCAVGALAYVMVAGAAVIDYWVTGEVGEDLVRRVGFMLLMLLLLLAQLRSKRPSK